MAIEMYDNAIADKLKAWTQNTNMHVYTEDNVKRVFEVIADGKNDQKIELPMIIVRRTPGGYKMRVPNRETLSYDGQVFDRTPEKSFQVNAIPIQLQYQLDIYARYFNEADEYMRNIIFNLMNFPNVVVPVQYGGQTIEFHSAVQLSDTISDNSSVPERLVQGQFTRLTIEFTIDDAYLWDFRYRDNYSICLDGKVEGVTDNLPQTR